MTGTTGETMGPTVAYITHSNLQHNIRLIRKAVGKRKIMAVVKANGYGHGDIEIARSAIESGCEALGVAFLEEGIRLRENGITTPILVFGAQLSEYFNTAAEHQLAMTVSSPQQIEYLSKNPPDFPLKIHIKIDTGMNRVGFFYNDFVPYFHRLLTLKNISVEGIYSHFATSDERELSYAQVQLDRFNDVTKQVREISHEKIIFHMANSGAIMQLPDAYFDMVRPGIMLYGYAPDPAYNPGWDLKPVMALHSRLGLVKLVRANEPISYGRRYYTEEDTNIGVIPAGYADGFDRRNTNNAFVMINRNIIPLVGTVCMDMIMANLGKEAKYAAGDEVVIYGGEPDTPTHINQIAARLGTIPYEVTCKVSSRVPRIHIYK